MLNPTAVPILTSVLQNVEENAMVRHEAAEALGAIALPESIQVLEVFKLDKFKGLLCPFSFAPLLPCSSSNVVLSLMCVQRFLRPARSPLTG